MFKQYEIFISVHDQDLILQLEKNNIFRNISDYKYLFLGSRPIDKLSDIRDKVVIARDLPDNIEHDKCLFDYTGWYALVKNNLIRGSHVVIVHYDCLLYKNFEKEITKVFKKNPDYFINFQPHLLTCDYFIPDIYAKTAIKGLKDVFDIDIQTYIDNAINNGDKYWPGGGSFACSKEWLESYVDWIEKIHSILITDPMAAHNIERTMKFYNLVFGVKEKYLPHVMKHIFNAAHNQTYQKKQTQEVKQKEFQAFIDGNLFNCFAETKGCRDYIKLIKYTIEQLLLKF